MCGIVGYTGSAQAAPILLEGLSKLEYRGYDSAGIAVMGSKDISVVKVTGRIAGLCEKTDNGRTVEGCVASATPDGPPTARRRRKMPTRI